MKMFNLESNQQLSFTHQDHEVAFAYAYAQDHNLKSQFANNLKPLIDHVRLLISKGRLGYSMGEWSIPFSTRTFHAIAK
jgi:hypothetical protein